MKFIFIIFIFLLPSFAQAQQSDPQLAYTYYQNKEYEKAAELFFKLYERTRSSSYLDFHIICLINNKDYEQAESVLKKFLKTDDNNKDFLINLGFIYEQQGKSKKTEEYFEKAIQKLIPQNGDIQNLANKFRSIREYSWATKTYLRGRELLKQPNAFLFELGDNYSTERDYENMFKCFIQALEIRPTDINSITSKLAFVRSYDLVDNLDAIIEKNLAILLKQNGYLPVFDELAGWYALQKKDYTKALQHATLLNQKVEDKLYIYLNIAQEAAANNAYKPATEAYNYILAKGKENNHLYPAARKEILVCDYKKYLTEKISPQQYQLLAEKCKTYMQEFGNTPANVDIAVLMSDIYAYHLQQPDSANMILEKTIQTRGLNSITLSQLKSKRADLLTFMDNPWEATILYTQIEKANPNNDIGYEAKLKKAWLAYYCGDILWARAQFEVLKGATSKLISNDAIKMAHFINANYEQDENNHDLEKIAKTEYLIYKKQTNIALPILDSLINNGTPGIADYATLQKALLLRNNHEYENAIAILDKLKNNSGQTYIRAEAIYELADLKKQTQEFAQARDLYKLLVSEYSGSVYSIEAGRLYREIEKENK